MSKSESNPLSRRRLFAGVGTAGALVAAAAVLPRQLQPVGQVAAALPKPLPETGGGYQLTAHVQRYYQTTKV